MRDPGCEVRRRTLPRTRVNRCKRRTGVPLRTPVLYFLGLSWQAGAQAGAPAPGRVAFRPSPLDPWRPSATSTRPCGPSRRERRRSSACPRLGPRTGRAGSLRDEARYGAHDPHRHRDERGARGLRVGVGEGEDFNASSIAPTDPADCCCPRPHETPASKTSCFRTHIVTLGTVKTVIAANLNNRSKGVKTTGRRSRAFFTATARGGGSRSLRRTRGCPLG
jgi:hypothetical protein